MDFKAIFKNVGQFFIDLYQHYFPIIIISIVLFVAIIITLVYVKTVREKRKQEETKIAIKQAIASLTDEEIENISKNVSNPSRFREMVDEEVRLKKEGALTVEQAQPTPVVEKEVESVEVKDEVATTNEVKPKKITKSKQTATQKPDSDESGQIKRVYTGKWKIKEDDMGFYASLHASNGGLLLKTEHYTSLSGVKSGIETIKRNAEIGNFAISIDKHNHYHFKLFSSSNKLICVSEDYSSKAKCDNGISSVKRFAPTASIILEERDDT